MSALWIQTVKVLPCVTVVVVRLGRIGSESIKIFALIRRGKAINRGQRAEP